MKFWKAIILIFMFILIFSIDSEEKENTSKDTKSKNSEYVSVIQSGHTSKVTAIDSSFNDKYILSGDENGTLILWSSIGQEIRRIELKSEIKSIQFSQDNKSFLVAMRKGGFQIIEFDTFKEIANYNTNKNLSSARFSKTEKYVFVQYIWDGAEIFDINGNLIKTISGYVEIPENRGKEGKPYEMEGSAYGDFSEKDELFYYANLGEGLFVYDFNTKVDKEVMKLKLDEKRICIYFINSKILIGNSDGINVYDKSFKHIKSVKIQIEKILKASEKYSYIVLKDKKEIIRLYDFSTLTKIEDFEKDLINISSDSKYIFYFGKRSITKINRKSKKKFIFGNNSILVGIPFSESVVYDYSKSTLYNIFNDKYKNINFEIKNELELLYSSQNFDEFLFGNNASLTRITLLNKKWNYIHYIHGNETVCIKGGLITPVFFEDQLITTDGATVKFWNAKDGKKLKEFRLFSVKVDDPCDLPTIFDMTILPKRKLLLTGDRNGVIKFWNFDGETIKQNQTKSYDVLSVISNKDEKKFLYLSKSDKNCYIKISIVDVDSFNSIKEICTRDKPFIEGRSTNRGELKIIELAPNDQLFYYRGENTQIFDINGEELFYTEGGARAVKFLNNEQIFILYSNEGKIYNFKTKKLVATVLFTEHGKLIQTPDGRFDYDDPKAVKSIVYRKGDSNEIVGAEEVFQDFYTPGLMQSILTNTLPETTKILTDIIQKFPPPKVMIDKLVTEDTAKITIKACDMGGGLDEIFLYHNDVLFSLENSRGIQIQSDGNCKSKVFQVKLVSGSNEFKGVARNKGNIDGISEIIQIEFEPKKTIQPNLHIVLVGINEYRNPNLKLKFAVKDAKAIKDKLKTKGKKIYKETKVYEVYDKNATRDGIKKVFADAAKNSNPEDVVIVFLAGHGFSQDRKYYFIQQDNPANNENAVKEGISQDELTSMISSISALKKLVIIDTCQSGGDWLVSMRGVEDQTALGLLAKSTGVWVIAASQSQQYALESSKTGHGLLTSSILEGFDGKAKIEKFITVGGLLPWINKRVPDLAKQLYKREQFPYTFQRGQDFPIGE